MLIPRMLLAAMLLLLPLGSACQLLAEPEAHVRATDESILFWKKAVRTHKKRAKKKAPTKRYCFF